MEHTKQHRATTNRASVGRIGAAVFAAGALSTSAFAVSTAGAATTHTSKTVVISTFKNKKYGTFLVSGNTVYTVKASKSPCTAACHKIWPEVLLPKGQTRAKAAAGVDASKLGTVTGVGGALQVTYAGAALYWFSGDKAPGQVKGDVKDVWGSWSDIGTVKQATPPPGTGGVAF